MSKNISQLELELANIRIRLKKRYQDDIDRLRQEIARLTEDAVKHGIELNNTSVIPDFKKLFEIHGGRFNRDCSTRFMAELLANGMVRPELEYGSYRIKYKSFMPHLKSFKYLKDYWQSIISSLDVIQRRYKLRWEKCKGGYIIA
jgi:hypothetical protein